MWNTTKFKGPKFIFSLLVIRRLRERLLRDVDFKEHSYIIKHMVQYLLFIFDSLIKTIFYNILIVHGDK